MRTHLLKNVDVRGREKADWLVAEFDFYRLGRLLKIEWECQIEDGIQKPRCEVLIKAAYKDSDGSGAIVVLLFKGVATCKMPELSPHVYLSEMEIDNLVEAQLEGIRYHVKCYGEPTWEIFCLDFEIFDVIRAS